jgi:PAS domain S-box-containing protein
MSVPDAAVQEATNVQTVEGNVTRFERLGLEDGLSQGTVYSILQDSQGFLWVATQDGLNKYDGYTFTVHRHDPADPASLSSNVIYVILEDSDDDLWLGTDRGLVRFDKRSEVFTPYGSEQEGQPSLDQVMVRALLEDSQGMLWIGTTAQGLYRLDRRTGHLAAYQHDPEDLRSLASNSVTALLEDAHGTLWVGMHGGGLCRLDRQTGECTRYGHRGEDPLSLSSNNVTALREDAQGILWIGTETGGLNALDIATPAPTFIRYQHESGNSQSLSHDHVTTLLEDTAGTLWVGTGRGLVELDRRTKRFRRHYPEEGDPASLSNSEILSLAEDAQGILWIGTRMGLDKFDRRTRAFGHFRRGRETQNALSSNAVTAFLEDTQGFLWIGTYGGGLNRSTTDSTLAGFVHFEHREDDPHSLADRRALPDADRPHPLGENAVLALCEDAQARLWIGTGAGLHRLVPDDDPASPPTFVRYRHEPDDPSSLSHNFVVALAGDAKENLWIGTYGGLNRLNQADAAQGFVRYLHDEDNPHSISHDFVRTVHIDSAGNVWIGTNGGLNRFTPGDDPRFIRYQHDEQDPHSISHDRVQCMAEDARGNLWIGTRGGLNRFDPQTGRFTAYREQDGLSNDVVYGVLVDDRGHLWLSTNNGINRFDPTTERFTHYDVHDGVQADEFADGAFYRDRLGRLYYGGVNGFNVFHPGDIQENTYLPPVVLTNFLLANQPVPISESGPLGKHITFAEQLELAPEDYVFAFEFSALNYRQPHKNRFAYKLEGFDRDWIYTDARDRKAVYTNVPPGTYTFRVKAANDDRLWNEGGTSIQVTVSQPWWHIVFRSAFEAVVIHDRGTILQANQAALELYGYEQAELIGQSVYKLVAPEMHGRVAEHIARGDEMPYESKGVRKDGSVFVSEVRARAIPYQGRVVRVTAVRDITERKRAEEALRQSQEFLQAALDSLSAHIAILDSDGTIVTVNAPWRRFAEENGLTWSDYGVGHNYLGITEAAVGEKAGTAPQVAKGIREVMAGQRPHFWLQYPCHSPGEERWFEMRVTRFENPQGVQVAVSHENITDRVQALQALQQSEAKFRGFVEQSTDGILVVDERGEVIEWNRSLEEITGLARQEVLGAPAWEVQYRLVPDKDRAAAAREWFKAAMLQALRTGEAPWLGETVQAVYRRTDGATRHVEQRLFPIQTDQGFRIGGISADITERREAEAQLRTLSRAVEQSDSTILVTDLEGTIEFVNPAFSRITGYTAQEAMGQNPRILKSGQMPPETYAELWQTIKAGQVWEGELLNKRKDGRYYWESAIISPVRDASGDITHYVAVKQDITARKRAEEALERQLRHEKALAACSQTLLRASDPKPLNTGLLNEALGYLMEAVQAGRACVFRNFHDPVEGFCSGIVAEAVAPGLPRNLENPFSQKIPWSSAPVENRLALQAGQACGGPTEEVFASTPELLGDLMEMGILSVLFFPIHFGDEWWGYVGFDDCQTAREWNPQETIVLRTASQMIGSALQRWQAEAALQKAHDELDQQVQARTAELNDAVERLRREVGQRERAEAETRERLVIQQGLAAISTRLMQAAEFEDAIVDVLAQTATLFDAKRVFLVRLQGDGQTVHRIHEWCASGVAPLFHSAEGWNLSGVSGWLEELRERGWFYIKDTSQAPHEIQKGISLFGGKAGGAFCAIPVYARQEMIGFLGCHGLMPTGRSFDQHLQVLEVVVGIVGSAWLRERVLETLDQRIAARTRELSTFFDLTTLAIGAQDLSEMLDSVPGRVLELGSCDALCIHLLDAERTTLTLAAQGNLPPEMRRRLQSIALDSDFLRRLEQRGEPLLMTDPARTTPLPPQLRLEGFSSYMGVPLSGGWVSYYRTSSRGFSLDESSLLLALAEQVGVSVENYRLRQRIEAAVTLEERGRLARDLHDSVTQSLYSLSLFARSGRDAAQEGDTDRLASSLTRLEATALQALREMRLLLYELRPSALEQQGLIRTLEQRFDAVERRAGMNATVAYESPDGLELPQALERELYYLTIEALNNALKHARAQEVMVRVWLSATQVQLEIADDGGGFDPGQASGGYGLDDMRERVERLGGRLEISSAPGAGTRIHAWIDLTDM